MRSTVIITLLLLIGLPGNMYAQTTAADSLISLGDEKFSNGNYTEAAELEKEAIQLYLQNGDSLKWAMTQKDYATTLIAMGAVKEAVDILLELDERKIKVLTNEDKASIKKAIGYAYRNLEQYEAAQNYYLEGLELLKGSQDSSDIAGLYNNISYTFSETGNYEQALEYQYEAKRIYEKLDEKRSLSRVLNGIFLSLMDLGLYEQAEPYIRQSLALSEQLGEPRLLDIAYHNLAWNFENQGKRDSAIIYYRKSLELTRQLGNPYEMTQTLNNIGGLYEESGDYENALAYYNEALEANYQTDRPVSIGHTLRRLARVAIQNNDLDNATTFYEEAQNWLSQAQAPRDLAMLYLDQAELEIIKEHHQEAKRHLNKAEEIARKHNFKGIQSRLHTVRGQLYYEQGKLRESLGEYRKAYRLSADETVTGKIGPAINLARSYHRLQSDSAFILADQAFTFIDSVRTNVAGLSFRSGFFREHAGFYNEVASWYITQKNQPEKAFDLIEAAKARVLMDEMAETQQKVYENLDEATLIKKQQLAKQIDRLHRQIEQAKSKQQRSALQDELKDLEFEYQTFLNEIHVSNPALHNFEYPRPIALEEVQDMLNRNSALLEYAFAENSLVRLLITNNSISGSVTDSLGQTDAKSFITEKIKHLRETIIHKKQVDSVKKVGEELHASIIPDLNQQIMADISNLLIIPGGPLIFLPFEALSNTDRYLIEDFGIKYLPSASIYPFIKEPHRTTNFDLLAVAGSGFEGGDGLVSESRSEASFASLPSALLEVDSISVHFSKSKILKNEDVTEATLKSHDLSDFRYLHFATHASVNEESPSQSGLLLSKKADVESLFGEDGHLNSREIAELRLNADLVILSACNTGMGKVVTGEGLIGLQRSFLAAGSSSVMVSLWSVFDRSTSVFMAEFYEHMLTHQEEDYGLWEQTMQWLEWHEHPLFDYKANALRDAKLAMIDHPYYNHPVYWAPFILVGK
ncbi:CHAT domain-containing protein [Gracilimonas mengyeensis]|uniref:CHAT domain-containing protein n=1 Tax=Gracilimonas mengyeensis TaxID=1302730 RepID=A0A521DG20_9BACT|nr:CHAT domain-containing protein [Gracilimonas mengyeensis]SMO70071.1 CHAT domain-containing protein [Gracilimonas mengyeensis]